MVIKTFLYNLLYTFTSIDRYLAFHPFDAKRYESAHEIGLSHFTFMIWEYFYKELERLKSEGIRFDLSNGIMIHGGGWKKLSKESVSPKEFHHRLNSVCLLDRIHDYYGMVEQTGCIYMQCEHGHLHASIFSDIVARRAKDFSVCDYGEKGILQVVSVLPESYPGHSLLTEDEGIILGEDDCPCGRKGKYFEIIGRIKNAEIRGCSDTFTKRIDTITEPDRVDVERPLEGIGYLVGNKEIIEKMFQVSPMKPFDDKVLDFLSDVSKELIKEGDYPDIVTLGFWLRKGSLSTLKEHFKPKEGEIRIGRGVAFHIAPSNVPVNYAYSLFTGLLCGNANIVRVPSKDFIQIQIINTIIEKVLDYHHEIKPYICLVRYGRNKTINDVLSAMCDIRIIWGGDQTIYEIRKSMLRPRTVDITFADRYSLAIIDSAVYIKSPNKQQIARRFYNDTYLSDQNACTSPRAIVWMGNYKDEAKTTFWNELFKIIENEYSFSAIQSIDKLTSKYEVMAEKITKCDEIASGNNMLIRLNTNRLDPMLMYYRSHSGFFYEINCDNIIEIKDFCNDIHCQTIVLLGDKDVLIPLFDLGIKGVDRVANIGHSMDFDLVWDGYNLVERMTRSIRY